MYLSMCSGMVELLARLSANNKFAMMTTTIPISKTKGTDKESKETKDNSIPNVATMETLLRVLDGSGGKEKLIRADRRSVSVRKFNFLK